MRSKVLKISCAAHVAFASYARSTRQRHPIVRAGYGRRSAWHAWQREISIRDWFRGLGHEGIYKLTCLWSEPVAARTPPRLSTRVCHDTAAGDINSVTRASFTESSYRHWESVHRGQAALQSATRSNPTQKPVPPKEYARHWFRSSPSSENDATYTGPTMY